MAWNFSGDRPIYSQLVDKLRQRIVTGEYPPGSRVAPVRELAEEAGVNPNTMQRALSELEAHGLVYTQRTAGRFVTEDAELIAALRAELARQRLKRFLSEMEALGFTRREITELMEEDEST